MIIKNRYFIFTLSVLALLFNFSSVIKIYNALYCFFLAAINNYSFASAHLNFSFVDILVEGILLTLIIPLSILLKKPDILEAKISFLSGIIIILGFIFIFPYFLSSSNPDFQKNIGVTQLRSPGTKIIQVQGLSDIKDFSNEDYFIRLKQELMKDVYEQELEFRNEMPATNPDKIVSDKIFILGTDEFGRDVASRIIYGSRISYTTGALAVILTLFIGTTLGFISGSSGGFIDLLLNRIAEMFLSFPIIFLIILILGLFGSSFLSVIIVLGISGWMSLFKIVRGEVMLIKSKDYYTTSKKLGLNNFTLMISETIPVISAPVIVNLVFQFGSVILAEAAISYLGLGIGNSYPSWGSMINEGQSYIYKAWWLILFPGLMIFTTLLVINSLGKKLRYQYNLSMEE